MPLILLFLWAFSILALWTISLQSLFTKIDRLQRGRTICVSLFASWPPTLLFALCFFVLIQSSPTVQFNAGNSKALNLWSFWVQWWQHIFGTSVFLCLAYLVWGIISYRSDCRSSTLWIIGWAFSASVFGAIILSMAYPTA